MKREELFDFFSAFFFLVMTVCEVLNLKTGLKLSIIAVVLSNVILIIYKKGKGEKFSNNPIIKSFYWLSVFILITDIARK